MVRGLALHDRISAPLVLERGAGAGSVAVRSGRLLQLVTQHAVASGYCKRGFGRADVRLDDLTHYVRRFNEDVIAA